MAHTSEHLAVLGNIERYYASEKGGGGASNLPNQLKRNFCVGILFALVAVMATIAVDLKGKYFCVSSSRIRYLKVFHS